MVDLSSGIDKLPPAERLKRLRLLEEEKRKSLEEELSRKKKELAEVEKKTKKEIEETEALKEEALEEIEEEGQEQLEERVAQFRKGKGFIPEGGEEEQEGAPKYASSRQAPGFGQQGSLYRSETFQRTEAGIDYLLHGRGMSTERELETERELYQNVRQMRERLANGGLGDEGYAFNRLQEQAQHLKERGDRFGYAQRIVNVLNDIVDYRQQDERRHQ